MKNPTLTPAGFGRGTIRGNALTQNRRAVTAGDGGESAEVILPSRMPRCDMRTFHFQVGANEIERIANNDEARGYFMIQNLGVNSIYVSFGSRQRAPLGFEIKANGFYEPLAVPVSEIFISSLSGSDNVTVIIGSDV